MGKYFRTIYLYIVSFATLCMVVAGFVGAVNGFVSYTYPVIEEYEIEETYYDEELDEELRIQPEAYQKEAEELVKKEQRVNLKIAFTYLAVFVCGTPLYAFHVKQIRKESEKEV